MSKSVEEQIDEIFRHVVVAEGHGMPSLKTTIKRINALLSAERRAELAFLDRINLEVNANICKCGEPWVDSDIADLIRDRLAELRREG